MKTRRDNEPGGTFDVETEVRKLKLLLESLE